MKRQLMIRFFMKIVMMGMLFSAFSQPKKTIAVVSIDTKGIDLTNEIMADIVRLELEKTNLFEVLDKYDVNAVLTANGIKADDCFGKNAVVRAGDLLQADKMLTGSLELFGEKIIMILRMIDTREKMVETTAVKEFISIPAEIQTMVLISMNELLGIPNDQQLVDLLINYDLPFNIANTFVNLSGPRMGASMTFGSNGKRMQASDKDGGYNMFPVTSMFGYQFEKQYLSAGNFQALVETLFTINGLESGTLILSVALLNGFRFNDSGFEFGLGPNIRLVKLADGYYNNGEWVLAKNVETIPADAEIERLLDNRGKTQASIGLLIAAGKTFHSGYLNIPVNLFLTPRKNGTVIGFAIGFNTTKKPRK